MYFGEYSSSDKVYRTQVGPDEFFYKLVKFLLEVTCVHPTTYAMPKKKVNFIIATYKGDKINRDLLASSL